MKYIWQCSLWPNFTWDDSAILRPLGEARYLQGNLLGRIQKLGFQLDKEAHANILEEEAIKTSAIEGERLDHQAVRSSVARHLGLPTAGLGRTTRSIDGLIEAILDATQNYNKPLSFGRLKEWHAALFPTGYSGLHKIRTGRFRGDEPMQIVSGSFGREKVHFEAPQGKVVKNEMKGFLRWWLSSYNSIDGILRAAIAHFYFTIIHPFEDGNGRIARVLTEMCLAQDEKLKTRYYSLSSMIMDERKNYYDILEITSKRHNTDVTEWLIWFLECYKQTILKADIIIGKVLMKDAFWRKHAETGLNDRQCKVLNCILEAGEGNFLGGLTTRKYVSIGKVSRATAFREILDMLGKKVIRQLQGEGRNVHYDLIWPNRND